MIISVWDIQELCVDLVDSLVFIVLTNQPQPRLSDKQTYLQRIKLRPEPFPKSIKRLLIIIIVCPNNNQCTIERSPIITGGTGFHAFRSGSREQFSEQVQNWTPQNPAGHRALLFCAGLDPSWTGHLLRPPGWTQIRLKNSQLLSKMNQSGVHLPPVERHFNYRYATWALLSQWPVSVIGNDD